MASVSRRRLAKSVADRLLAGEKAEQVLKELAAYLIEHKQTTQYELYVADIEQELARGGSLIADVTTARELDDKGRALVKDYVQRSEKTSAVTLREHINPELIGGIVIRVNGRELNAAISSQLRQLKTA